MATGTSRDRTAWVLNLDADLELAAGDRYSPTQAVRAAMTDHVERLAVSLLAPGDVLVDERSPPGIAEGLVGRAFCPTSRAVALLVRAGARPDPHPSHEVLRSVNGRAFCAALGQTLPEAVFARDLDTAVAVLSRPPSVAKQWRVKRAFGMAGRGQRLVAAGPPSEADTSFLRSSIAGGGGVQIEPSVDIVRELGIHGRVERDGSLRLGHLVVQDCDAYGQWLATTLADVDVIERLHPGAPDAITSEARRVASSLTVAGYFGPFGVDAFVFRDLAGAPHLQPRSEINARYSMGFAVGFVTA
jgi:hypothetical protein